MTFIDQLQPTANAAPASVEKVPATTARNPASPDAGRASRVRDSRGSEPAGKEVAARKQQGIDRWLVRGSIVMAALAVLMTVDALIRNRSAFDYRVIRAVQEIEGPYFRPILLFVSDLTGSFWAITLWASLLLYLAVALRSWLPALTVALIPLGGVVNWVIGHIVNRPKPEPEQLIRSMGPIDATAFPSGQVAGAVMFYGVIFLLARNIRFAPLRVPIQAAAVTIVLLAGPARIWFGVHWVSDVAAAYALGFSILLALVLFYRRLTTAAGDLPFIHAVPIPVDESIPRAHALTSTILFQDDVVTKIYAPGFLPRAVYWLSFQAEFPYIRNRLALDAAVLRRNLAGKLTEYWFGSNRVARAYGVVEIDGRLGLASERIETGGEQDSDAELRFLYDLCNRFDEAGLPTWQIDPRQPRGKDNVLHGADGRFYIVDLESGLVSPLASPRAWWRAIERAEFPMFDTVYFDITRDYIERSAPDMRERMGDAWYAELVALVESADEANERWHAAEPRIWSRLLRWIESGFGIGRYFRRVRHATSSNRERAEGLLYAMVDTWESEGRIKEFEAAEIRRTLSEPQIHRVIPHFAIHLTIGIAMRFPVGSILRATYTILNLLAATISLLARKIDRAEWRRRFSIHSPLVIIVAAMPGIGTFAYLLSGPIRSHHMLLRMAADTMLLKVPWRLYERIGWRSLVARPEGWASATAPSTPSMSFGVRTRKLALALSVIGGVLVISHLLLELMIHVFEPKARWIADLAAALGVDTPDTVPSWYALLLLGAAGCLSIFIAIMLWTRNRRAIVHWGALALIALGLSFEEHVTYQPSAAKVVRMLVSGDTGFSDWPLTLLWIPGIAVATILGYHFVVALPMQLRGLIIIGILMFVGGAAGLETVGDIYGWIFNDGDMKYKLITSAEELAEIFGTILVFYVLLEYARSSIGANRSRPAAEVPR
ncbi:MAG: phosphatase PAP2 family protein [Thermomicrobiales bacterium]